MISDNKAARLPAVSAESSSGQDGPGAEGRVGPRDDAEENLADLARRAGPAHAGPAASKAPFPLFARRLGCTESTGSQPGSSRRQRTDQPALVLACWPGPADLPWCLPAGPLGFARQQKVPGPTRLFVDFEAQSRTLHG